MHSENGTDAKMGHVGKRFEQDIYEVQGAGSAISHAARCGGITVFSRRSSADFPRSSLAAFLLISLFCFPFAL